jgi:hypothetical protein
MKGDHTMNRIRRKALQDICDRMEELRGELEEVLEAEEEAKDNIPEAFAERIEAAEDICYTLEELVDLLSNAQDMIVEIV